MNRLPALSLFVLSSIVLSACSDGPGKSEPDAAADVPKDFEELIMANWTAIPGQEMYRCARLTVTEDTYIGGFRSIDPAGTHHAVLSVSDNPTGPDGEYDCGPNTLSHTMLYASGVGTADYDLREGVAMKVDAGSQLQLNLHIFNATGGALDGRSGTYAKLLEENDVEQFAEVIFGGTFSIGQPPSPDEQTAQGECTLTADATYFSLWPHMHQLGTHMKVEHFRGDVPKTLHDDSFSFDHQIAYPIEPLKAKAGDRIRVTCSYINDSGQYVTFGDSSTDEMCFVGLYRYPATGANLFSCAM